MTEEALYYILSGVFFTIGIWIWVYWHIIKGWKRFEGGDDER